MSDSDKSIGGLVRRAVSGAARTAGRAVTGRGATAQPPPAKKSAVGEKKSAAAKKSTAHKPAGKKSTTSAKKTAPTKRATAKVPKVAAKAPAKKSPSVKKTAPPKKVAAKAPAKKAPAKRPTKKTVSGRTPGTREVTVNDTTSSQAAASTATPESLPVLSGESPWTAAELKEVWAELDQDAQRLRAEIREAEADIADMLRDVGDVGGEDQADTGSKTFAREHEMSLVASQREMLAQTEQALGRIADGTYGICENCGNPVGKARLQAFPRARLCMTCKQREERR